MSTRVRLLTPSARAAPSMPSGSMAQSGRGFSFIYPLSQSARRAGFTSRHVFDHLKTVGNRRLGNPPNRHATCFTRLSSKSFNAWRTSSETVAPRRFASASTLALKAGETRKRINSSSRTSRISRYLVGSCGRLQKAQFTGFLHRLVDCFLKGREQGRIDGQALPGGNHFVRVVAGTGAIHEPVRCVPYRTPM